MKITLEYQDLDTKETIRKATLETDSEVINDVLNDIKGLLIAYGFHENTVKEGIIELGNELEGEE